MTPKFVPTFVASIALVAAASLSGCSDEANQDLVGGDEIDNAPPAVPAEVSVERSGEGLLLTWAENAEPDLAGYIVQRSLDRGTSWSAVADTLFTVVAFEDEYRAEVDYRVSAMDTSENQSAFARATYSTASWGGPKVPSRPQ
jgi:hypothetical protein